jgi:hypothetical protein
VVSLQIVERIKADHLKVEKQKSTSLETAEQTTVVAPFVDQLAMLGERCGYPNPIPSFLRHIYTHGKWFATSFICRVLPIIEEVTKDVYGAIQSHLS